MEIWQLPGHPLWILRLKNLPNLWLGSAVSGEGLVNVYRGSGKIWLAPVLETGGSAGVSSPQNAGETASEGKTGSAAARNDTMSKIEKFGKFMDKFS